MYIFIYHILLSPVEVVEGDALDVGQGRVSPHAIPELAGLAKATLAKGGLTSRGVLGFFTVNPINAFTLGNLMNKAFEVRKSRSPPTAGFLSSQGIPQGI